MSRNDHSPDRPSGRQPAPEGTHAVIVIGSFRRWLSGTTRECRGVDHKDDPPAAVETDSSRLRPSLPPSAGERVSIACSRPIAFGHIPSRRGAGPPAIAVGLPAVIHSRRIFRKSGHDPSCRVAPFVASPHSLAHYEWPNNAPGPPQGAASSVKPQGLSRPSPADRLGPRLAPVRTMPTAASMPPGRGLVKHAFGRVSGSGRARCSDPSDHPAFPMFGRRRRIGPHNAACRPPEPSAPTPLMMPISGLPTETYPARVSMRARPRHAPGISCPNPSRCRRHSRRVPAVRRGGPRAAATHRLADVAHLGHTHAALSRDRVPADGPRCSRLSARPQDHA